MFRIYWRPADGGPERWAEASSAPQVLDVATRASFPTAVLGGEYRLESTDQGWTVPTTLGAIGRWRGTAMPEALAASGWEAGEALTLNEGDLGRQLAGPLSRAVAHGLLRPHQAERLREIAEQAVAGVGPAGRDMDLDEYALAPFVAGSPGTATEPPPR